MARRLVRTAAAHRVPAPERLEEAFRSAMGPRHRLLSDDHDPRYLHPARTALVLMDDVGMADPVWLAAAILAETCSPELRWTPDRELTEADALREAWVRAASLPAMDDPELAERLVTSPREAALVTLAEHLDQLRHLRLWAGAPTVRRATRAAQMVLLPVARREHPVLARRLEWWVRRVGTGLSAS